MIIEAWLRIRAHVRCNQREQTQQWKSGTCRRAMSNGYTVLDLSISVALSSFFIMQFYLVFFFSLPG